MAGEIHGLVGLIFHWDLNAVGGGQKAGAQPGRYPGLDLPGAAAESPNLVWRRRVGRPSAFNPRSPRGRTD